MGKFADKRGLVAILAAGALVRIAFMVAWRPAFMGWPDAKSYIDVAHGELFGNVLRPAGYPLFLRGLELLVPDIRFVVIVNHALGLATAALLYATVVRATGSRALGLLPAAVVALGGDGIFLEHSPLSEPLFAFLVAVALYAAVRVQGGGSSWWALAAGTAVAASSTVRVVGLVVVPIVVLWLAVAVRERGLLRRLAPAACAAAGVLAVLGSYAVAEHDQTGAWGLSRNGDWHLYARVAPFADCTRFTPPAGTEKLCENTPREARPIADAYLFNWWYSPAVRQFRGPFDATPEDTAQVRAFARAALIHQPLDYLHEVSAGMLRYVAPNDLRGMGGGPSYSDYTNSVLFNRTFQGQGLRSVRRHYAWSSERFLARPRLVDALRDYAAVTRIHGPVMVLLALLSFAGPLLAHGRARACAWLFTLTAWTLLTVPVAVLEFSARTAIPGFGALAAAAALGTGPAVLLARSKWEQSHFRRPAAR